MNTALKIDRWDSHWQSYHTAAEENPAQQYRRKMIFSCLSKSAPVRRFVDFGSGQGDLCSEASQHFPTAEFLGLELSEFGIAVSQKKVPTATFIQDDLTDLSTDPGRFKEWATHGVCSEVLEHVEDPLPILKKAHRYLAADGVIVLTVPGGPMSAFDRHIGHRRHFTAQHLRDLCDQAGFETVKLMQCGFPFMNLYRLVVILRGRQLILDVDSIAERNAPRRAQWLARKVMAVFGFLFRFNLDDSPWGWQMVAVIRPGVKKGSNRLVHQSFTG